MRRSWHRHGWGSLLTDDRGMLHPMMWREPFPSHTRNQLVSYDNPKGTITNSDLESAATIAHHDILAQAASVVEKTIHTLSDNTVHWQTKGSTTTTARQHTCLLYTSPSPRD